MNDTHKNKLAQLGDGVYVDPEALIDGRALVQANSGGGKSYTIRKLCEIVYGSAQIIVLDVEGEFYTLRERDDYVLFGPNGDYPATVNGASLMARRLLELGTSAVIDIYELGAQRAVFIARFLEAIMAAPRELWHDLIIVVDEANKYCPEGGQRDKMTEESANAIVDLMTRGRKRGYCGVLATQRLSALDKNAAAECNNVLIGRCNLDVDIARAAKMIGMKPAQAGEILPELAKGQFYVMGPAITTDWSTNRVAKIKVGQVVTTHPKRGQKVPVPPARAAVKKAFEQLKGLEEAAKIERDTIEGANKQVAYWMGEYQRLKNVASTKTAEINEHFANEYQEAWKSAQTELEELKSARHNESRRFEEMAKEVAAARLELNELRGRLFDLADGIKKRVDVISKVLPIDHEANAAVGKSLTASYGPSRKIGAPRERANGDGLPADLGKLNDIARAFLTLLVQRKRAFTKRQILLLTGYRKGGHTDTTFADLLRRQLLVSDNGVIGITQRGRDALGEYTPLPHGAELRAHLVKTLPDIEGQIMEFLYRIYPQAPSKTAILSEISYRKGGHSDTAFARLIAAGYITSPKSGHVRASEELFE